MIISVNNCTWFTDSSLSSQSVHCIWCCKPNVTIYGLLRITRLANNSLSYHVSKSVYVNLHKMRSTGRVHTEWIRVHFFHIFLTQSLDPGSANHVPDLPIAPPYNLNIKIMLARPCTESQVSVNGFSNLVHFHRADNPKSPCLLFTTITQNQNPNLSALSAFDIL